MRPSAMASPSRACNAGNGPARERICGRTLVPSSGRWVATKIDAARSAGSPPTSFSSAATPPAEAPITTISWVNTSASLGPKSLARGELLELTQPLLGEGEADEPDHLPPIVDEGRDLEEDAVLLALRVPVREVGHDLPLVALEHLAEGLQAEVA